MHAIKCGWAGQAYALATNNESGGRKSRIRRSKEERKAMVESFIKKYQKKNDGNFPSLNLTHKEVGGSFYTVREIVREIIQENRVLAPPKLSLEEHDQNLYLDQHPLGSISIEPQVDLSVSDRLHVVTHVLPNEYQTASAELISSSSDNGNIINGQFTHLSETSIEEISESNELSPQSKGQGFENEKTINGSEVPEEILYPQQQLIMNANSIEHHDNKGIVHLSSERSERPWPERLSDDEDNNEIEQTVDIAKEFDERVNKEPEAVKILDKHEAEAKEVEASEADISHMTSNVVVETFPIRPVSRTIHDVVGESNKSLDAAGIFKDEEKMTSGNGTSELVSGKDVVDPSDSTVSDNVVQDLQEPALGTLKHTPGFEQKVSNVKDLESKNSLPNGSADSFPPEQLISNGSFSPKESNPTLDRINLDTWEGESKKSSQPETNPLMAFVKSFISAFVKFWTE